MDLSAKIFKNKDTGLFSLYVLEYGLPAYQINIEFDQLKILHRNITRLLDDEQEAKLLLENGEKTNIRLD